MSDRIIKVYKPGKPHPGLLMPSFKTCQYRGPVNPILNAELKQGYVDFAVDHGPYDWFGHFTFRDFPHPEKAEKAWSVFDNALNMEIYGRRYKEHGKRTGWFRGTELQYRGAIHFHALIKGVPETVKRLQWANWWNLNFDGTARIYPYDMKVGAVKYCAKYILKDGCAVDVGGSF